MPRIYHNYVTESPFKLIVNFGMNQMFKPIELVDKSNRLLLSYQRIIFCLKKQQENGSIQCFIGLESLQLFATQYLIFLWFGW